MARVSSKQSQEDQYNCFRSGQLNEKALSICSTETWLIIYRWLLHQPALCSVVVITAHRDKDLSRLINCVYTWSFALRISNLIFPSVYLSFPDHHDPAPVLFILCSSSGSSYAHCIPKILHRSISPLLALNVRHSAAQIKYSPTNLPLS